jgi:hypothetical protein
MEVPVPFQTKTLIISVDGTGNDWVLHIRDQYSYKKH